MPRASRDTTDRRAEERRFADELGFFWEDAGGTRMAGRVLGVLLLADPPEMSSSDLAEFLGVSAGSVSIATRELIRPGVVSRVRIPGVRQDHFRATLGANISQFMRSRVELNRRWAELLRRGEILAAAKNGDVRHQLAEIRDFFEFIESEQASILARWERRRRARSPASAAKRGAR